MYAFRPPPLHGPPLPPPTHTAPLSPPDDLHLGYRYEVYTAIRGPFGTTDNLHSFPEIDIEARFPSDWAASSPAGLCTGNNSALLSFRTPRHDFWGGSGDLDLLTVDASSLDGSATVVEVNEQELGEENPCQTRDCEAEQGKAFYSN